MSGRDRGLDEQADILGRALDRCGRNVKTIAYSTGVAYRTLHSWISGENRMAISEIGRLARGFGSADYLNEILRPHGYVVVELPAIENATGLAAEIHAFQIAGNRLSGACGKAAGSIADATDIGSEGGEKITKAEAEGIQAACDEVMGFAAAVKEWVQERITNAN